MKKFQVFLLIVLAAQLCVPAALYVAGHIAPQNPLVGAAFGAALYGVVGDVAQKPALTRKSWFGGDFADGVSKWFGQNFPGRNPMVRWNNELDFDLFQKSTSNYGGLIVGRHGQLYESVYLENYCAITPPIPVDTLDTVVRQMADLQGRLTKHGTPFVLMITPGKPELYPDDIPEGYRAHETRAPRNYDNLIPLLKRYGITYVDGLRLLESARNEKDSVYCRGSIHWNFYGAYVEAQALEDVLNERGLNLAPMHLDGLDEEPFPTSDAGRRDQDYDLAQMLNLTRPPVDYMAPVLKLRTEPHSPPTKNIVFAGGSFTWKPIWLYDQEKLFKKIQFYYYYHTYRSTFPDHPGAEPIDVTRLDWKRDIFGADAVVLEINESTMGSGVYQHYTAFVTDALKHIDAEGHCH